MQARMAKARRTATPKKVALKSDFHANGSELSLWPKRLARWHHQQLPQLVPLRLQGSSPPWCSSIKQPGRSASLAPDKGHLQKTQGDPGNTIWFGQVARSWDGQCASREESTKAQHTAAKGSTDRANQAWNARHLTMGDGTWGAAWA